MAVIDVDICVTDVVNSNFNYLIEDYIMSKNQFILREQLIIPGHIFCYKFNNLSNSFVYFDAI